jgi:hypothetical protein
MRTPVCSRALIASDFLGLAASAKQAADALSSSAVGSGGVFWSRYQLAAAGVFGGDASTEIDGPVG